MLDYCAKLTVRPWEMQVDDVQQLREAGFDDGDVLDVVQIASFFNYINRVADALGVEPEDFMRPWPWKNRGLPPLPSDQTRQTEEYQW